MEARDFVFRVNGNSTVDEKFNVDLAGVGGAL